MYTSISDNTVYWNQNYILVLQSLRVTGMDQNVCLSVGKLYTLLYTSFLKASETGVGCIYYGAVAGKVFWFPEIQIKNKSISWRKNTYVGRKAFVKPLECSK